jgi:hypothetical protein
MSNPATVSTDSFRLFGRNKKQQSQTGSAQEAPVKPKPKKLTGFRVAKYEIAEDKVKFSNMKGLSKKRWVVEKEYPVYEITAVETQGNWLRLTCNNQACQFLLKKRESFAKLQTQIQSMQLERQKAKELNERFAQRRADLLGLIGRSLPIVDSSFDILIGLHAKRVDWRQVEAYAQTLGASFSIKPITLPPLDLDYAAVNSAITTQVAKETSKEALAVLKAVHSYFTNLKQEDDLARFNPNSEHVKAALLAYYTLNDLLLAKVVGEKDSEKEVAYLKELLTALEGIVVKVDLPVLLAAIDGAAVEDQRGDAIFGARAVFREQLKQF